MNEKESFESVLKIISPFVRNADHLKIADVNSRIWEDLQVNSSRFIDILLDVEAAFDLELDIEKFEGASTLGDLARLLIEFTKDKDPTLVKNACAKLKEKA